MSNMFKYYDSVNANSLKVHLATYLIVCTNYFILGELTFTFNTNGKFKYIIFKKYLKYFVFK
jgi:hypothetical protein